MIPWWSTDFGEPEISNVSSAIRNKNISQGKVTRQFEEKLAEVLGVPYVICTTSGTTALTMALLAAGIGPGHEVIVPDRTWIATAHAVMMTGARVRLHDVNEEGLLPRVFLGPQHDAQVAIPVNLNGRMAEMPLSQVSMLRGGQVMGAVIEDSCQAFPAPPRGLAACYSLSTAKLIATGQGGFVATRDEGFAKECRALRTHDVEDAMVPQVLTWKRFGYNFRFTDIQAAIGIAQLARLPDRLAAIREIHAAYKAAGVPVLDSPTPLYNEILHPEPERLRSHLLSLGIEARPFYPPLHTAPYLKPAHKIAYADYEFPNAMKFSFGLYLPSGPNQSLADIERVAEAFHAFH